MFDANPTLEIAWALDKRADRAAPDRAAADQKLLIDQREANAQLIQATIRAQELTDKAEALAEKLTASERALRATAEFREQLLGIIGHDLRNPLAAISMCGQLLSDHGNLDEADAKLVARLLKSTQRMDRMIAQIFEFTQARLGGGLPLELDPTDLHQLCHQAVEELALGSSVRIDCKLQGDLKGTWDAGRLVEVLSNLLSNAIDHAAPGTPVLVRASGEETAVLLEIQNQGPAIPADLLPVLFAPFHHGRPHRDVKRGHLGLGLYISHEIVRSHGGTLTVKSVEGTTILSIRLPRLAANS